MSGISQHPEILQEFATLVREKHIVLQDADAILITGLEVNKTTTPSTTPCRLAS